MKQNNWRSKAEKKKKSVPATTEGQKIKTKTNKKTLLAITFCKTILNNKEIQEIIARRENLIGYFERPSN